MHKLFTKKITLDNKLNFPLPHVFPLPPFPLCINLREPTASASRGATLSTRIDRGISLLMPLRFVRQLRTQTAQSLVLLVKLGVRFLAAVAARVPSSKSRSSYISLRLTKFFAK